MENPSQRLIVWVALFLLTQVSHGLCPPSSRLFIGRCQSQNYLSREVRVPLTASRITLSARGKEEEELPFPLDIDGDTPIIIRGSENDDIDGSIWEDAETGQPPEWLVMKEVGNWIFWSLLCYTVAALLTELFVFYCKLFLG